MDAIELDMNRVKQKLSETLELQALLAKVFRDDEELSAPPARPPYQELGAIDGLDLLHSSLLRRLPERPSWSRAEFDSLCGSVGVFSAGAMETINEFAFDRFDAPLLEGDDPVVVDINLARELPT